MHYVRPTSVKEAVSHLRDDGILLAGGTVLVPSIKYVFDSKQTLVDISYVNGLGDIREQNGLLQIGSAVRLAQIAGNKTIKEQFTALAQAAEAIGNPQVRRVGTIGGNLAIGIPGADLPPALLILDAEVVLTNSDVEKLYPVDKIIQEGLPAGHLITAIHLPVKEKRASAFRKFAWRLAAGKTIVNVAAAMRIENNRITEPGLAAGGLSRARRLTKAEGLLDGQAIDKKVFIEAARTAAEEATVEVTIQPGEKYRRKLVAEGILQILLEITKP